MRNFWMQFAAATKRGLLKGWEELCAHIVRYAILAVLLVVGVSYAWGYVTSSVSTMYSNTISALTPSITLPSFGWWDDDDANPSPVTPVVTTENETPACGWSFNPWRTCLGEKYLRNSEQSTE